jgi:hypothetical protein
MALFGWLVLVALAVVLSVITAVVSLGVLKLRGRLGLEPIFMAGIVTAIWLGVVWLRPFTVTFT